MLDVTSIPDDAAFEREENGVQWYSKYADSTNIVHYMVFEGQVLSGSWVGPHRVLWALVLMTPEERNAPASHDEMMGKINLKLMELNGK